MLAVLACNMPVAAGPDETRQDPPSPVEAAVPAGTPGPTVSITPQSTETPSTGPDAELARYGVTVLDLPSDSPQRAAVLAAVQALAAKIAGIAPEGSASDPDGVHTFSAVFGPTVIRIDPSRAAVDGVHAGLNCGWEGQFATGCKQPDIFPQQTFPNGAWLILIGGAFMSNSAPDSGVGLVAHELIHNLTWGGGNLPSNVGGWSFVRYVGDDFAFEYMDYFGVQIGRYAYETESARTANPTWRSELTADALASWALDEIDGPDQKVVVHYIQGLMVCKVYGVGRC
jgi:hypothetical protein